MNPPTEQRNRSNNWVRLVDYHPDTNLSDPKFANDVLLVSGTLKHTTTKLNDLTTATTAHGLQQHHHKNNNHLQDNIENPEK